MVFIFAMVTWYWYRFILIIHARALDELFPVIHAAESYEVPIALCIYDYTHWMDSDHEVLSFTPATQSAIDALEKVRLDAATVAETPMCAICQEFAVEDVTRMPCLHYYHGDCILQWLHVSHLCPMCRYPMPVDCRPPPESLMPLDCQPPPESSQI
ncbi:hypothetical protein ACLB2K_076369 [Fragaria x ananassa]